MAAPLRLLTLGQGPFGPGNPCDFTKGDLVFRVQQALVVSGYAIPSQDFGTFTTGTCAAVRDYARRKGLGFDNAEVFERLAGVQCHAHFNLGPVPPECLDTDAKPVDTKPLDTRLFGDAFPWVVGAFGLGALWLALR